jgi:hypothetical protein
VNSNSLAGGATRGAAMAPNHGGPLRATELALFNFLQWYT